METSTTAVVIFVLAVAGVLALSTWLGRQARSSAGYFSAHGAIPWWANGIAFAGDYLSAASFLGICGLIAKGGYDGLLYSIGFLAGWVVALFIIAEPMKRLGRYTFADALDSRFGSRGIRLTAAVATLVISLFYLIPQMVGAGVLVQPLLGLPYWSGVLLVGGVVIVIVATAGMVSTTWVQFIKGSLLVGFCLLLTIALLWRGHQPAAGGAAIVPRQVDAAGLAALGERLPAEGAWAGSPYVRVRGSDGVVRTWRARGDRFDECRVLTVVDGKRMLDGVEPFAPRFGHLEGISAGTGPLSPVGFVEAIHGGTVVQWKVDPARFDGAAVIYPVRTPGERLTMLGGGQYAKLADASDPAKQAWARLDFVSLMLALFLGTASLPHILIRYYTVKDARAARSSTVVGIAAIGGFYLLTLFLGLGAMTSGVLDPTDAGGNLAAPLLARSFGEATFAVICAIAFTTILGTVAGLILAASGAIAHDLIARLGGRQLDDAQQVRAGRWAAVAVGIIAMGLGLAFQGFNISFLVGWAFNIAASANLPALAMLLFWRGTTKQGLTAAVAVGLVSSLGFVLLTPEAYANLYHLPASAAPMPMSQPALITVPLGFIVLIAVSLLTRRRIG